MAPLEKMSNEFMLNLQKQLLNKTYGTPPRNLSESTANAYIKALIILNDKKPFKNLTFLKKREDIMKRIAEYAPSTQKTVVATIVSILSLVKASPTYKKVYDGYVTILDGLTKKANEVDTSAKTETQEENWIEWKDVEAKLKELQSSVDEVSGVKNLNESQYSNLLKYVVLSLYSYVQPRRNQDYMDMYVVRAVKATKPADLPKDKNYVIVRSGVPVEFVFNKYKTSKKYGQQILPIPNTDEKPLGKILTQYIKFNPKGKHEGKLAKEFPFLVSYDGSMLTPPNAITRLLNKIFGKKIGSSMLRHIYLSSKYNIGEMSNDAEAMGHSLDEQRQYMKKSDSQSPPYTSSDTPSAPPPTPPTHQ